MSMDDSNKKPFSKIAKNWITFFKTSFFCSVLLDHMTLFKSILCTIMDIGDILILQQRGYIYILEVFCIYSTSYKVFSFTLKKFNPPSLSNFFALNKKDQHPSTTYFPYFRRISKHNDRELNIPYSRRNLYPLESTFSKNFATLYFRENMYFRFERISKGKSHKKSTQNPLYSV